MAINPNLISVKTASELPTAAPTSTGEFFFFEGNEMKKSPMTDIYDKVSSAYMGIATTSTTPPPTGAYWYRVNAPGTYMGITVTTTDLNSNDVFIEVKDNVATKRLRAFTISTSTAKIETWSAKVFTSGSQVIYEEQIYEANASTVAGDVPGVASVWVKRVGGVDITDVIDENNTEEAVSGKAVTDYVEGLFIEVDERNFGSESEWNKGTYIYWEDGNTFPNGNPQTEWLGVELKKGEIIEFSLTLVQGTYPVIWKSDSGSLKYDIFPIWDGTLLTGNYTALQDGTLYFNRNNHVPQTMNYIRIRKINNKLNLLEGGADLPENYKLQSAENTASDLVWQNGYMNAAGNFVNQSDMRFCRLPIKKGEAITYKGNVINGAPVFILKDKNDSYLEQGFIFDTEGVMTYDYISKADGFIYLNKRDTGSVQYFKHFKLEDSVGIVPYLNSKLQTVVEGEAIEYPFEIRAADYYLDVIAGIIGTATYKDYIPNVGTFASELIAVNKGDVLYYSGRIGSVGVGLYNFDGILSYKLLVGMVGVDTDVTDVRIIIPASGYVRFSSFTSATNKIKIARGVPSEIDFSDLKNVSVSTEKYVQLSEPKSLWKLNLIGVLPATNEEKKILEAEFIENERVFLKTKGEFAWQGQSSINNPKKNYTFDILNANEDSLKLKIGDMIATDSFHLKGFQKDVSLTRDYLTSRMWYNIRKAGVFPDNRIDNLPLDTSLTATDKSYFQEDAKFYADGFPVEIQYNGAFLGIYVFRLKKSRENYKLDNSKKEHIFLEYDYTIAGGAYVLLKWQSFEPIQYELKSPKISGYVPGATITDTDVMNSINGLWSWTTAVYNNSGYVAHENKVVLSAWIDYLIAVELASHWDGLNQNILLMTHDGIKWSPYIYDTDHTWGIEISTKRDSKTAFVLDYDARGDGEGKTFWKNFRTIYLTQIKERYTELRRARVISIQEIEKTALDFSRPIGYEHYKKEFAKWGYGLNPTTHGKLHLQHILTFANSSINFIDSRWLLP